MSLKRISFFSLYLFSTKVYAMPSVILCNTAEWRLKNIMNVSWYNSIPVLKTKVFLFVHHTTSILVKLSTWCFEHSVDISCSLLITPSHTDESWEGRNTCLWIYNSLSTLENSDVNRIFFVCSPHHKHFGKAQHPVLWALWWHQLFSTR